ncbi:4703_t:CDS:1, partial [Acaulospora morrowiae]
AFLYRSEICPKPKREGKRKQWNVISFDKPNDELARNAKPKKSVRTTSKLPTPTLSPPTLKNETSLSELAENSPILDLDMFADWEGFLYPSPDLSAYSDGESSSPEIDEYNFNLEINSPLQTFDNFNSPTLTEEQFIDTLVNSPVQIEEHQLFDSLINSPIQIEEQLLIDSLANIKDNPLTTVFNNQLGIFNPEYLNTEIFSNDLYNNQLISSSLLDDSSTSLDSNNSYYF